MSTGFIMETISPTTFFFLRGSHGDYLRIARITVGLVAKVVLFCHLPLHRPKENFICTNLLSLYLSTYCSDKQDTNRKDRSDLEMLIFVQN